MCAETVCVLGKNNLLLSKHMLIFHIHISQIILIEKVTKI